ncbi:hypothetical protein [Streptomyces subrutilus]|uniref:Uncharacterized protein n=1 Tax=Streptomyces subrutilus TaxID=36818 RepID=A0A1E5PX79_9ACTN|nr:hypothetical protein [Streptomyces subrutilus]OEJ34194.1 hypothetical protein BGK67_25210 [Streptomyces subrutilus]
MLSKMSEVEKMTVQEMRNASGGKLYKEYATEDTGIIREARDRLTSLGLSDMTKIGRIRFAGTQRLYGFLEGTVFHVLWWDPNHEVYPSKLKHT